MNRIGLFEYRDNKQWVTIRKERIEEECENIQNLTAIYGENIKGSPAVYDSLAENLARLLDMKIVTLDFAIKLEQNLAEIDNALLKIEQPYRNILTFVYIEGKSLVDVASDMNYNYKYMCKQHGKALKKFDNL